MRGERLEPDTISNDCPAVSPHPRSTRGTLARGCPGIRCYGAAGRARILERMAAELELTAEPDQSAAVDLNTAAELSGFSRARLRRLIRDGKLATTADGGHEDSYLYAFDAASGSLARSASGDGNQWSRYHAPVVSGETVEGEQGSG